MHIKGKFNSLKHLDFILLDSLSLILAFLVSYWLVAKCNFDKDFRYLTFISVLLSIIINAFNNTNSGILKRSFLYDLSSNFISSLQIYFFIFLSVRIVGLNVSNIILFVSWIMYLLLSSFTKYTWKMTLLGHNIIIGRRKPNSLVIIVNNDTLKETVSNIKRQNLFLYNLVGVCCVDKNEEKVIDGIPIFQKKDLINKCLELNADEVLVCVPANKIKEDVYKQLRKHDVIINFELEALLGFKPEDQHISKVSLYKTLTIDNNTITVKKIAFFVIKRFVDILAGIVGTLLCVPLAIIVKLAYVLKGDTKSIFFKQKRVGKNGKIITIYKFRTMVYNAEEILVELLKKPEYKAEWEKNQKFENDPRITPIGKFLRRTSLDEFPQFLNVLLGEMSLIGPRPLVENELLEHGGARLYQRLKPGITGWWGCNGRSNLDYESRLELEYYYIQNCSLTLDLMIIVKTIIGIIRKDGAK